MKLFVTIYNDARLLGHFLRHYAESGITRFYIATAPEFRPVVEAFTGRYAIDLTDTLMVEESVLGDNSAITQMRQLHQGRDEWVVIVDLDEFVEFPSDVSVITAQSNQAGANVVRGIMLDRFSADGQLADFRPESDLEMIYPVKSRFIRNVMGGCDHKGVLVKGLLRPAVRSGHHRFDNEIVFTRLLQISHYKWTVGALDRLRKAHQLTLDAGIPWAGEYRLVFQHYEAHGRFAWEEFGGRFSKDFRMEEPIRCLDCGAPISDSERAYSHHYFGSALCRSDQQKRRDIGQNKVSAFSGANFEDPRVTTDRLLVQSSALAVEGNCVAALQLLKQLENATVDEGALANSDVIVRKCLATGTRVVATCDPARVPSENEHVVIYGSYPISYQSLLVNKVARRHSSFFWTLQHDVVESHAAWAAIDHIYIINIPSRVDRLDAVLNELARAQAPLDRIERVPAAVPSERSTAAVVASKQLRHAACLMSHISVLERARDSGHSHILVLEDDFCFTSDVAVHLRDLRDFFQRNYDYWICLLASNKYGVVVPKDDLIAYSLQPCTNTAAYLVSASGIDRLLPVWSAALQNLKDSGVIELYAIDRSWCSLQSSGRFFLFRRKMGYQRSSWSDIEFEIARNFD